MCCDALIEPPTPSPSYAILRRVSRPCVRFGGRPSAYWQPVHAPGARLRNRFWGINWRHLCGFVAIPQKNHKQGNVDRPSQTATPRMFLLDQHGVGLAAHSHLAVDARPVERLTLQTAIRRRNASHGPISGTGHWGWRAQRHRPVDGKVHVLVPLPARNRALHLAVFPVALFAAGIACVFICHGCRRQLGISVPAHALLLLLVLVSVSHRHCDQPCELEAALQPTIVSYNRVDPRSVRGCDSPVLVRWPCVEPSRLCLWVGGRRLGAHGSEELRACSLAPSNRSNEDPLCVSQHAPSSDASIPCFVSFALCVDVGARHYHVRTFFFKVKH